jgi:hypothetical protein
LQIRDLSAACNTYIMPRTANPTNRRLPLKAPDRCPSCNSPKIAPKGSRTKKLETVRLYRCRACGPNFTPGPRALRNKTYPLAEILEAMTAYNRGYSLEETSFRSLTEALDTTTAQGLLVFHMFSALAEFDRSLIRERTRAGLAAARRIGRTGGHPPKLTDDDLEAARALLANPRYRCAQIAHRLGVSPATLYRYIPAARTANTPAG